MASITSANAVYMLSVSGLFLVPQQLQGFSADDIFDTEVIAPTEVLMGLDGKLSAGYVPVAIKQSIVLQADSPSNDLFDAWYAAQQALRDVYFAKGLINLSSIRKTYALVNGVLSSYPPIADGKKVLQPRKFGITWETAIAAPL